MAEGQVDDQMIEIGDPTEEPTVDDPAPQVVIEYHERGGVPWMLIPPLLVLSAVAAILFYIKVVPHSNFQKHDALASKAVEAAGPLPDEPEPGVTPSPSPIVEPGPKAVEGPAPDVQLLMPVDPVPPPLPPINPLAEPPKVAEPAPLPKVEGLGFDPKALEADRKVEAPADPALAAVGREERPDDRDLPREVDPDLLPPDPRQARARQEQRKLEIARKVEEERFHYHAELKAICRKLREESGPDILEMKKRYDVKTDPAAEKSAAFLLGKHGKFAGADRSDRIELLRTLGYPEPVILDTLFNWYEKQHIGERDGPKTPGEAYYLSAQTLLRNPPRQLRSPSKPVSAPSNGSVSAR